MVTLKLLSPAPRPSNGTAVPIFADLSFDDRGHSNEQPGYYRRQVQFFSYKVG